MHGCQYYFRSVYLLLFYPSCAAWMKKMTMVIHNKRNEDAKILINDSFCKTFEGVFKYI